MRGENRIFALLKRRIRHVELFCNRLPLLCNLKPVGLLVRVTAEPPHDGIHPPFGGTSRQMFH